MKPPGMCWTITMPGASAGKSASSRVMAWTPPVLTPMAMIRSRSAREPSERQLERREQASASAVWRDPRPIARRSRRRPCRIRPRGETRGGGSRAGCSTRPPARTGRPSRGLAITSIAPISSPSTARSRGGRCRARRAEGAAASACAGTSARPSGASRRRGRSPPGTSCSAARRPRTGRPRASTRNRGSDSMMDLRRCRTTALSSTIERRRSSGRWRIGHHASTLLPEDRRGELPSRPGRRGGSRRCPSPASRPAAGAGQAVEHAGRSSSRRSRSRRCGRRSRGSRPGTGQSALRRSRWRNLTRSRISGATR